MRTSLLPGLLRRRRPRAPPRRARRRGSSRSAPFSSPAPRRRAHGRGHPITAAGARVVRGGARGRAGVVAGEAPRRSTCATEGRRAEAIVRLLASRAPTVRALAPRRNGVAAPTSTRAGRPRSGSRGAWSAVWSPSPGRASTRSRSIPGDVVLVELDLAAINRDVGREAPIYRPIPRLPGEHARPRRRRPRRGRCGRGRAGRAPRGRPAGRGGAPLRSLHRRRDPREHTSLAFRVVYRATGTARDRRGGRRAAC